MTPTKCPVRTGVSASAAAFALGIAVLAAGCSGAGPAAKAHGAAAEQPGGTTAIRPFRVNVSQPEIDELRRRVQTTRWPEQESVVDRSQGAQHRASQ